MYNKAMDLDGVLSRIWSIPTTWRVEASCRDHWVETCMLARCWLEMTYGAHDDMRLLWLLRTSYMVDLEDLMH